MEQSYKEKKWKQLPPESSLEPHTKYFIDEGNGFFSFYITTSFGELRRLNVSGAAVTTLKFFLGNGTVPVGYSQKPLSSVIQDDSLIGAKLVGFLLVNGTPYEPSAADIVFDPNTGTLDLSVFGTFYDGATIVVMIGGSENSGGGTTPIQPVYTDRRERFTGSTNSVLQLEHTRVAGKNVGVYYRGVLLDDADYTLGSDKVTLNFTRSASDVFIVIYTSVD